MVVRDLGQTDSHFHSYSIFAGERCHKNGSYGYVCMDAFASNKAAPFGKTFNTRTKETVEILCELVFKVFVHTFALTQAFQAIGKAFFTSRFSNQVFFLQVFKLLKNHLKASNSEGARKGFL